MPTKSGISTRRILICTEEIHTLTVGTLMPHSSLFVGLPKADHSRLASNRAMEIALPKKSVLVMFTVS